MKTKLLIIIGMITIIVASLSSFIIYDNGLEDVIQESIVIIPKGSYVMDNNLTFEPKEITVVIGVNNTVRWLNQETTPIFINSINGNWTSLKINPNESEFLLFVGSGIYEYFGHPWMQGKVVVLEYGDIESKPQPDGTSSLTGTAQEIEAESDAQEITDSLKIPNAERDAKLAAGYKLYPGVGWVHPDDLGNQKPIYKDNPDNPGELILDIDAMIKAAESKQEKTPPSEPPFEKEEPFTKIEIMFGEKLDDKLVPVTFTEVTTHAETLDKITVWMFQLIGHSGDDRRLDWDFIPKDKRIWYEITDDDGQEIIDYTRMPENWAVPSDLHNYEMDCGLFHTVTGESAHPTTLLIKNNTSSVFAKNSWMGIYPDSNGEYFFEFASIFEHYVRLPEDIGVIISHETKECDAMWQIDGKPQMEHDTGYYTKMSFRLE